MSKHLTQRHTVRLSALVRCSLRLVQLVGGTSIVLCVVSASLFAQDAKDGVAIAPVDSKLDRPVDFERDVLPIFDAKCLACHSLAVRENGLNLEGVSQIVKGGKRGAAVVANDPEKSLLYQVAARAAKPAMPPLPNKVEAAAVTPQELGILRQWILEGAAGSAAGGRAKIEWRPLPRGMQPIYAVALTPDGQFAAAGRANKLSIYHVPTGELVAQPGDSALGSIDYQGHPMYEPGASHRDFIQALAFNPAGTMLASGSYREVKFWTRPDRSVRLNIADLAGPASAVAVSPDDKLLALAAGDNSIRLYQLGDGQPVRTLAGHTAPVSGLKFSADGSQLYSCSHDKTVRVWTVADGAAVGSFELPAPANALTALPDGSRMLVACADKQIRVLTGPPAPLALEREISGHAAAVTSLAIVGPQGARVVSGSEDGTVRVWEFSSGKQLASLNHGGAVTDVAVSADGQRYASTGASGSAKLWDAAKNQQIAELKGDWRSNRSEKELTADDAEAKAAVKAAADANAAAVKALASTEEPKKKAAEAKVKAEMAVIEPAAKLKAAQTTLEGARAAADEKKDDAALKKALADAEKAFKDAEAEFKKVEDARAAAATSVEQIEIDIRLATAAIEKTKGDEAQAAERQKSVEAALAAAKAQAAERLKPFRALAFSRDGKELALAGQTGTIFTFDGTTGAPWAALDGHTAGVLALAYAGPRMLVSTSADQSAKVWNLNSEWTLAGVLGPKKEAPLDLAASVFVDRVMCVAFSPDGSLLAAGGGDPSRSGELTIWDVATQTLVRPVENSHSDVVLSVDFSHDGRYLLSGAADKFVKIHEVGTGAFVRAFEGHTSHVLDVAWRHGDKQIASAGADNVIKVWNAEAGDQLRTIAGYSKQVSSIQYMGRGPNVVSCGGDRTVRFHISDNGNNFRNFGGSGDFMYSAAASADEKIVVAGGQDGVLRVWNGANGQVIKAFELPKESAPPQANPR